MKPKKQNKKKREIFLLDFRLKWKAFKELQKRLVRDSGPMPVQGDRVLWEMMRDKKIYCWFGNDWPNDMGIGLKLPEGYKVTLIKNA